MNFNNDYQNVSSYQVPALPDLIDDLPTDIQHSPQSHVGDRAKSENQLDTASRMLNITDASLVSHIVSSFSNTSVDQINQQKDRGSVDSFGTSPYIPTMRTSASDPFFHKSLVSSTPLNPKASLSGFSTQVAPAPTGSAMPFQIDHISQSSRNPAIPVYPGGSGRIPGSRPVQAVAPQPRNPELTHKSSPAKSRSSTNAAKPSSFQQHQNQLQEENQQPPPEEGIRLKIRRTKKSHKSSSKDKHTPAGEVAEYGIVSTEAKREGPIKLKLSRVKPSTPVRSSENVDRDTTDFRISQNDTQSADERGSSASTNFKDEHMHQTDADEQGGDQLHRADKSDRKSRKHHRSRREIPSGDHHPHSTVQHQQTPQQQPQKIAQSNHHYHHQHSSSHMSHESEETRVIISKPTPSPSQSSILPSQHTVTELRQATVHPSPSSTTDLRSQPTTGSSSAQRKLQQALYDPVMSLATGNQNQQGLPHSSHKTEAARMLSAKRTPQPPSVLSNVVSSRNETQHTSVHSTTTVDTRNQTQVQTHYMQKADSSSSQEAVIHKSAYDQISSLAAHHLNPSLSSEMMSQVMYGHTMGSVQSTVPTTGFMWDQQAYEIASHQQQAFTYQQSNPPSYSDTLIATQHNFALTQNAYGTPHNPFAGLSYSKLQEAYQKQHTDMQVYHCHQQQQKLDEKLEGEQKQQQQLREQQLQIEQFQLQQKQQQQRLKEQQEQQERLKQEEKKEQRRKQQELQEQQHQQYIEHQKLQQRQIGQHHKDDRRHREHSQQQHKQPLKPLEDHHSRERQQYHQQPHKHQHHHQQALPQQGQQQKQESHGKNHPSDTRTHDAEHRRDTKRDIRPQQPSAVSAASSSEQYQSGTAKTPSKVADSPRRSTAQPGANKFHKLSACSVSTTAADPTFKARTNYMNAPTPIETVKSRSRTTASFSSTVSRSGESSTSKSKKKMLQHVRVKFVADDEEADIYKLKDVMYADDTEVENFDDLEPGTEVVAKWPMNGKLYAAVVIDPLDNTGRRFRERKPPPKPFQCGVSSGGSRRRSVSGKDEREPAVVLERLSIDQLSSEMKISKMMGYDDAGDDDDFNAYVSMADRIKLKRRERQMRDEKMKGKKRKRQSSPDLINVDDAEEDENDSRPPSKRSSHDDMRKRQRRIEAETRFQQKDGSCRRLMSVVDAIFEQVDTIDPRLLDEMISADSGQPLRQFVSKSRLQDLCEETAKLKLAGTLNQISRKILVRLMSLLEPIIRDGVKLKPMVLVGKTSDEQKWNRDSKLERVNCSTEAALTALNIMTAPAMSKAVYIDDVMERAAQLLRSQLNNTIFPEFDPVYKSPSSHKKKGVKEMNPHMSSRMKRAHYKGPKNRHVLQLYNKLNNLLCSWVELVTLIPLTDTTVLQISSVGISPFFVENVRELQLSAIRLTTSIFSRYEKHRKLILEDIFQSMARLPTSKRNLRSYRLTFAEETIDSSDDEDAAPRKQVKELQYIQMVSALILQMIQAIIQLPSPQHLDAAVAADATSSDATHAVAEKEEEQVDVKMMDELKTVNSYDVARRTGQNFLAAFLKKCASKSEEIDFRPLFENFVLDLLNTVNKPEWPASEMLLSLLGRLLVHTFSNRHAEMSLRVASLDYLGVVAAKLRRDALSSSTDVESVRSLIARLQPTSDGEKGVAGKTARDNKQKPSKKELSEEDLLVQRLEYLVLGYVRLNFPSDPSLVFAQNFYIGQWLRDVSMEFQQIQDRKEEDENDELQRLQKKKDFLLQLSYAAMMMSSDEPELAAEKKCKAGASVIHDFRSKADELAVGLSGDDATLITRYLASSRTFSRAFDPYLSYILKVSEESAVALRTRAIKCLAEVVAVDPSIMARDDISNGVRVSLVDGSTSVREAAVDLVGRFVLLKPDLLQQYYVMLTARILDTGVSVRKRVIKILRDLCHDHPHLPELTDACVKMIRRVNDEEGIKKLVHEVFMRMWFTPVESNDTEALRKKALLITDIVAANRERGYEWIEQLFKNLIDTPTRNGRVELACQQIVDCLAHHVIVLENSATKTSASTDGMEGKAMDTTTKDDTKEGIIGPGGDDGGSSNTKKRTIRLVATIQTMVYLAKIRPGLLVKHVMTLQPYLATKCEAADDLLIVHGVCRILELAVPLMDHPSETFLAALESDMMTLILTHRFHVVTAAVACLGAVVTRLTFNHKLVWECFQRMCVGVSKARQLHQKDEKSIFQPVNIKQLYRALFVIGHFSKNFDFDEEKFKGKTSVCVKDKVYDCVFYFSSLDTTSITEDLKSCAVAALGLVMIQDPNMMFRPSTRELYKDLLSPEQPSDQLKKQVLQNLQSYLQTEDVKMQEAAEASAKKAKLEGSEEHNSSNLNDSTAEADDIKEICDVSSGMSSSVMQLFLKQVLGAFFHRRAVVRHAALHTIFLTLQQGLVHPAQCVPYLIAATSDPEPAVHKEADQQLSDLSRKYSGFVHTKALQGLRYSFQLQQYVRPADHAVRGFIDVILPGAVDGAKTRKACCSHLYQLVRSDKKHRRAFILSLLHMFDDTVKTDLAMLIFVADNLAYFPYQTIDEPLFLMSQIEVYVSVSGSNVLQAFTEALVDKKAKREERRRRRREDDEDSASSSSSSSEDEDSDAEESVIRRLPDSDDAVEEFAQLSLACLLLLWIKNFLKTVYGFTDAKIHRYSPSDKNRANEKHCHRRRPDLRFDPQPAIDHLARVTKRVSCRSSEYKKAVAAQYSEFKELMNKLDPNENDSDSDSADKSKSSKSAPPPQPSQEDDEESDRDTDGEAPKPKAPLDIIRQSTALKTKKVRTKPSSSSHHHQQVAQRRDPSRRSSSKPVATYAEASSSDSEEEFRGF